MAVTCWWRDQRDDRGGSMVQTMDGPSPRSLANLVRAIAVLALPAADQVAWLDSLGIGGGNADELALELGDGFLLAPQFVENSWLPSEAAEPLRVLDALLASMSGPSNSELWDTAALETAPAWSEARRLARAALLTIR